MLRKILSLLILLPSLVNYGCSMADMIHTGGTNNLKKWYGPMVPDMKAQRIWFQQTNCEGYRLGTFTAKRDQCIIFEEELSMYKKACDEIRNGTAKYPNDACEALEIYETKYKNMPMPPYERQRTNKLGVQ